MTNFIAALKHDSTWDDLKWFLNNLLPKVLIYFMTSFMFSGFHSLCYRWHLGLLVQYFKMPFPLLVGWMLLNLLFSFGNCWCYILPLCERFWYWVDVRINFIKLILLLFVTLLPNFDKSYNFKKVETISNTIIHNHYLFNEYKENRAKNFPVSFVSFVFNNDK